MSVRVYTGPHADRRRGPSSLLRALPWVFAAVTVALQIAFPLVDLGRHGALVAAAVCTFFLASITHALVWRGAGWAAAYLAVTVLGGLAVEAVGLRTGWPFGEYVYGDLSATVLGVPWVVPLAWAMMAYPSLVAARALCRGLLTTPLMGALALASWDLFLDPMMTGAGFWTFTDPVATTLPKVPDVPLSNFAGWYLVAFVMMLLLDRLPRVPAPDSQPALLFLWTYASSVLANLFFFDRPWVALYGGVAMGVVAIPYAWVLWVGRD